MGKYADLIDGLFVQGKFDQSVFDVLVEADGRAFRPLVTWLMFGETERTGVCEKVKKWWHLNKQFLLNDWLL